MLGLRCVGGHEEAGDGNRGGRGEEAREELRFHHLRDDGEGDHEGAAEEAAQEEEPELAHSFDRKGGAADRVLVPAHARIPARQ